jgi:hypothetical protein
MTVSEAAAFVRHGVQMALYFYNFATTEDRQYLEVLLTEEYIKKSCPQVSSGVVQIDASA